MRLWHNQFVEARLYLNINHVGRMYLTIYTIDTLPLLILKTVKCKQTKCNDDSI